MENRTPAGGEHPDTNRLSAEEERAVEGLNQFGRALSVIHRDKLYRAAGYTDFGTYVKERWDRERTWAYREIWRCEVQEMLQDCNITQAQAGAFRPMDFDRELVVEVWNEASAKHARPTAHVLKEMVNARLFPQEVGTVSAGQLNATVKETRAYYGNRVGSPQSPTKDFTLMVPVEQIEEFVRNVNRLKEAWGASSMVDVVQEAVRRVAEREGHARERALTDAR